MEFVPGGPTFSESPSGQTVALGKNVTFTAAAAGANSFQWKLDGVAVAGATAATLVLNNVALTNAGAYTVLASSKEGLTMLSPPAVLKLDVAAGTSVGSPALLSGGMEVRVFSDNQYVDATAGTSGELTNVWSSLTSLGFKPVGFTGTNFAARGRNRAKLERNAELERHEQRLVQLRGARAAR